MALLHILLIDPLCPIIQDVCFFLDLDQIRRRAQFSVQ
jgi:hypothetical protein